MTDEAMRLIDRKDHTNLMKQMKGEYASAMAMISFRSFRLTHRFRSSLSSAVMPIPESSM